ncbi:MAG: GDSL-type esterase/lipase family protein [Candidatus Omnitrophota bacterium]
MKRLMVLSISLVLIFVSVLLLLEASYRAYKFYKYGRAMARELEKPGYPLVKPLGPRDRQEYTLKPGSSFESDNGISYKINSKGLRDYEYGYAKESGTYRIVALGDSYMFGWGVNLEDSYPKRLERILNGKYPGRKFEVINVSVYGYNTAQEFELLKREGMKYDPDLVILGFFFNDGEPQYVMPRDPSLEHEGTGIWFFEFVKFRLNILIKKLSGREDIFPLRREEYSEHFWDGFRIKNLLYKKDGCLSALDGIRGFLGERGVGFLVVMFPSFEYSADDETIPADGYGNYKIINTAVKDFCAEKNIRVFDLYDTFVGMLAVDVKEKAVGHIHLNERGYMISAEATARYLDESGIIPE